MSVSLVTGAGGFIGSHLCRHLASSGGIVRSVSRRNRTDRSSLSVLETGSVEIEQALQGVSAVYFLAGVAHEAVADADAMLMRRVNVEAPERWLRAAERAGVPRFVWLSSIKVLGDVSEAPLRPGDPHRPGNAYARAKVEAEVRLAQVPLATTSLAVVRPPLVYGSGVRGNFRAMLRWGDSGVPLPMAGATAPRSLVGVDNLCHLLLRLGTGYETGVFHAADAHDVSVTELLADIRGLLGRPRRQFAVPRSLLRSGASLAGRASAYSRLFEPLQVDSSDTRATLDWSPPVSTAEQLEEAVRWFRTSR